MMERSQKKIRAIMSSNNGTTISGIQHEEQEDDRISSLPDTLLISILSLLPIHTAAATSAVSGRWRHLWTHITHLLLDSPHPFDSSVTTINHIFSQLQSPKIPTSEFHLSIPMSHDAMVGWIDQICRRTPEIIKVSSGSWIQIPNCLFQTQSLIQLQLNAYFVHDHRRTLSFNLPHLKKLTLELCDTHIELIGINGSLFKGCPLLEDLDLRLFFIGKNDHIVDISTPNLKCLRLRLSTVFLECKLVMDAPKLEKFYFEGDLTFYEYIKNPSNLQEVEISLTNKSFRGYDNNNLMSKISGLIQWISCVRSLVLSDCSISLLDTISHLDAPPMFNNLIHLSISYIKDGRISDIPGCFLFANLKTLDIWDVSPGDSEIELVKQILCNATALEKLLVYVRDRTRIPEDQSPKEYEFCQKLLMFSKVSVNCEVHLFGTTFTLLG